MKFSVSDISRLFEYSVAMFLQTHLDFINFNKAWISYFSFLKMKYRLIKFRRAVWLWSEVIYVKCSLWKPPQSLLFHWKDWLCQNTNPTNKRKSVSIHSWGCLSLTQDGFLCTYSLNFARKMWLINRQLDFSHFHYYSEKSFM